MARQGEVAAAADVLECPECGETSAFSVSVRRERGGLVVCPCCGSVDLAAPESRNGHDSTGEAAA